MKLTSYNLADDINFFISEHYDTKYLLGYRSAVDIMKNHFIICKDGDKIVGVMGSNKESDNTLKTHTTAVHKDYRGQGVASMMNERMENFAIAQECRKMTCEIYTTNLPSLFLKLKRGYLIEGTRFNHDAEGHHDYILGLML